MAQRRLILETLLLGVAGAAAAQLFNLLLRLANWFFLGQIAGYRPPGLPNEGGQPHGDRRAARAVARAGRHHPGRRAGGVDGDPVGAGGGGPRHRRRRQGVPSLRRRRSARGWRRSRPWPRPSPSGRAAPRGARARWRSSPPGIASMYASLAGRGERDRRLLMLIGMAAGLSAIFRSPIGTALFAVEVLYSDVEFESDALLYTILSSIVAYAVNGLFVGWQPLFRMPADLLAAARPGPRLVRRARASRRASSPSWSRWSSTGCATCSTACGCRRSSSPPSAGWSSGLIALVAPAGHRGRVRLDAGGDRRSRGGGHAAAARVRADRRDELHHLLRAAPAACSRRACSSAPCWAGSSRRVAHLPPAPFVVVGMAAVFAGSARVPLATMMMVTEMTGGYELLVPAALAVMLSYLIQVRLSRGLRYRSLYEAQVPRRTDSPAHHTEHLEIALRILEQRQLSGPAAGSARPADAAALGHAGRAARRPAPDGGRAQGGQPAGAADGERRRQRADAATCASSPSSAAST